MKILVIEDNEILREATVLMLASSGHQAEGVVCAEDVNDLRRQWQPDVYVIDIQLPGESGLSLAQRLRILQPEAGIVITTARVHVNQRVEGYASGADIYLPKPVDPEELLAALEALGRRVLQNNSGSSLQLSELRCQLTGPLGSCLLTEAEVRLLSALVFAKNNTLPHWEVSEILSNGRDKISVGSIQVRISQLRKKLQSCGAEADTIRVLRNAGYRLCTSLVIVS